ncbi:hypothetical protein M9435_004701 [Picochlorum sp. BPE23]|nr:hypothetical protein M9435_004701 [Picochlorum sp. BPE23]
MKFGKYLTEKERPEWSGKYVDYGALKDLIKDACKEEEEKGMRGGSYSPRLTSLTVLRSENKRDTAEEKFFQKLEEEVDKIGRFTFDMVEDLRGRLYSLQRRVEGRTEADLKNMSLSDELLKEAKSIGDEFLHLEKYVNLNYMGFHKILKKHDKQLPHSPCRQFYISHLHNQPWVQGSYADLLVTLGKVYAEIRGDVVESQPVDTSSVEVRSSTKYWISMADVSKVKHLVLPHLPVYQFDENEYTGDSQLVNSVYLDNSSLEVYHRRLMENPKTTVVRLSWYGSQDPMDVHVQRKVLSKDDILGLVGTDRVMHPMEVDEFILPPDMIVSFIEGELEVKDAAEYWKKKQLYSDKNLESKSALFEEIKKTVDSKQLKPVLRSQYMRTYFQIPFDPTVQIKLDTNITLMKENPEDGQNCISAGRWFRDPSLPVHRTEVTRFPHAVLDLRLALAKGQETPSWVQDLVMSGMLDEVNGFSKHLHGITTLFPDVVQSVPYWVDRESVRASMLSSAPDSSQDMAPSARDVFAKKEKPRRGTGESGLREPLLDDEDREEEPRREQKRYKTPAFIDWWFSKPPMQNRPKIPGHVENKMEPKTYFANERTFLSWLHMALTMGSIATAMIGISTDDAKSSSMLIAMILLPAAILMCFYSVIVYYWRSSAILHQKELYYDDRRGPLALTCVIVSCLTGILLLGLYELFEELKNTNQAERNGSPHEWFRTTLFYKFFLSE